MSKSKKKPIEAQHHAVQHLVVNTELWQLIKKGEITHTLMTHQSNLEKGPLLVFTPGHEDEGVTVNIRHIFQAGHGYLAKGYPEHWRTRGSSNGCHVLNVERLEERAPTTDEGAE